MATSVGQSGTFTELPLDITSKMLEGKGDWLNTIVDQNPLSRILNETEQPRDVSPSGSLSDASTDAATSMSADFQAALLNAFTNLLEIPKGPGTQTADAGFDASDTVSDAGSDAGTPTTSSTAHTTPQSSVPTLDAQTAATLQQTNAGISLAQNLVSLAH